MRTPVQGEEREWRKETSRNYFGISTIDLREGRGGGKGGVKFVSSKERKIDLCPTRSAIFKRRVVKYSEGGFSYFLSLMRVWVFSCFFIWNKRLFIRHLQGEVVHVSVFISKS
jgi:hypothetical protein